MGEPPCTELFIRRARVADIARDVIDERIGVIEGAREIALLRLDVDPAEEDADLVAMDDIATASSGRERTRDSVIGLFTSIAARYGQRA